MRSARHIGRRVGFGLGWAGRGLGRVLREAWWWLSRSGRLWWQHKVTGTLYPLAGLGLWHFQLWFWTVVMIVPVAGFGLWARLGPVSYNVRVGLPVARRRLRRWVASSWPATMEAVGLARRTLTVTQQPGKQPEPAERVDVPALGRLRWDGPDDLAAYPGLLVGQTVADVEAVTERLRVALDAERCRVVPNQTGTKCRIVWSFGDPIAQPFNATVPPFGAPIVTLDAVPLGRCEDGRIWWLPLGLSTLTAGCSGSGKASLIWGLVFGLGPANAAGLVQLHGIDLKGGMELSMGRPVFTRYAQTAIAAVILLEDTAAALQARAARLAGITRQHQPSTVEPLVIVVIDELAALIAYSPDRDLTRRAEAALSVILSQGRAVGFLVFAFLQDPRKETVRMRHLFTQAIGLRLRDREEVAMVLGDGAIAAGALCHKIPASTPGVGYVLGEDNRPVRVRAGYVSDAMIRTAAEHFPAPTDIPIIVPDAAEPVRVRSSSSRSSRSRAGSGDAA